ncbi:glycosyltransferase family 4 protein, partial [Thermus thermophilus]
FFGRLEAYKGIDILVKAILALEGRRRALIAGPGQVPRILRRAMREHPSWFEVHNRYVPDEEAALFFQRASVLVLPYRQATQSSLPLIGAAFGLAVVASAVGAFVEDVPRVGGILVPPNNPQTLAQVLAIAKPKERSYHNPDLTFQLLARQFVAWLEGGLRR